MSYVNPNYPSIVRMRVWRYLLGAFPGQNRHGEPRIIRAILTVRKGRGLTLRPGIAALAHLNRAVDRGTRDSRDARVIRALGDRA